MLRVNTIFDFFPSIFKISQLISNIFEVDLQIAYIRALTLLVIKKCCIFISLIHSRYIGFLYQYKSNTKLK